MVNTYRHWVDGHYEGTEHEELDKRAVDLLHRASQVKAPHWQTFNTPAFLNCIHTFKTCVYETRLHFENMYMNFVCLYIFDPISR